MNEWMNEKMMNEWMIEKMIRSSHNEWIEELIIN